MYDLYLLIEEQEENIQNKEDNLNQYSNYWFEKNIEKNEFLHYNYQDVKKYQYDNLLDEPYPINKINIVLILLLKIINFNLNNV